MMIEGSVHTISLRLQDWSIRLNITLGVTIGEKNKQTTIILQISYN